MSANLDARGRRRRSYQCQMSIRLSSTVDPFWVTLRRVHVAITPMANDQRLRAVSLDARAQCLPPTLEIYKCPRTRARLAPTRNERTTFARHPSPSLVGRTHGVPI